MLSVDILRRIPMSGGVESVGRLNVNMGSFIHVKGKDGLTPYINEFGYWQVGDEDTGIKARGPKGDAGPQGIQGIQGPPVPVTQALGQSTTDAVSQKLLTDTLMSIADVIGNFDDLDTNDKTSVVVAINELLGDISKINTAITVDINSELDSLESELEKTVKQSDLDFGGSYLPYYRGESH